MDAEGYPDEQELKAIKKWDWMDVFSLIDFIEERWAYKEWGFKKKWGKDSLLNRSIVLKIELHTAGWSGNESLIYALKDNRMAMVVLGYTMWKAGGHYYFECNPYSVGYIKVSEMAKKSNITRQAIHKSKDKYDWLLVGKRNLLCRIKK